MLLRETFNGKMMLISYDWHEGMSLDFFLWNQLIRNAPKELTTYTAQFGGRLPADEVVQLMFELNDRTW
jgi:hypothetical protein